MTSGCFSSGVIFTPCCLNSATDSLCVIGWAHWLYKSVRQPGVCVFRKPVADIMREAGVQYALPPGAVELPPGAEWPVNFGALTNAKRAKCGKAD